MVGMVGLVGAVGLAAALPMAEVDRGGTTFNLQAISDARFGTGGTTSAFGCVGLSPSARVSSALANGSAGQRGRDGARPSHDSALANGSAGQRGRDGARPSQADDALTFALPDAEGGRYAVSMKTRLAFSGEDYRLRAYGCGGCRVRYDVPGGETLNFLMTSGDPFPFRREVEVPKGAKTMTLTMDLRQGAVFGYEELEVRKLPPRPPVELLLAGMHYLDNSFAVSRGQVGYLMFFSRMAPGAKLDMDACEIRVELPKGIEFVDTSFGDLATMRTETRADGSTVTVFRCRDYRPETRWNIWDERGVLVRAAAGIKEGAAGIARVTLHSGSSQRGTECCAPACLADAGEISILVVPPIPAAALPKRYFNGSKFGSSNCYRRFNRPGSAEEYLKFLVNCGVQGIISCGDDRASRELLRKCGIPHVFTECYGMLANGFMFGNWEQGVPEKIRYRHQLTSESGHYQELNRRAVCPVAVYRESDWFRNEWLPELRKQLDGADGLWANWELYMFRDAECRCEQCEAEFARFQDRFRGDRLAFRSWQHAEVVRTVNRYVTEFTGGEKSFGFLPGIEWTGMSSVWKDENLEPHCRPYDYAGDLKWIEPWGPYAAWEGDSPYFYRRHRPLAPFFTAADLRREVDRQLPPGKRPKLMALPQGFQSVCWVGQPETISMSLDANFFNRWDASVLYYFPKGADARYWRKFAEASNRAAKYEDIVFGGEDVTANFAAEPVKEFAPPCTYATRYLPESRKASLLQLKAYRVRPSRVAVAAFNFWQRGETFFTLRAKGLDGRYRVIDENGVLYAKDERDRAWSAAELERGIFLQLGAARTKVFELVPEDVSVTPTALMTVERLRQAYESRRGALSAAAAEDERFERVNPTPPRDEMPVI